MFQPEQKKQRMSCITEAKSLLSKGKEEEAFGVLVRAAWGGDVMACYDSGLMMVQGIGCYQDAAGGIEMLSKWRKLEKESKNTNWKLDGSVTELFEPRELYLHSLFPLVNDELI